jgi:transcriptional regulator with GAF, ATPase, and Fis domain
MTVRAGGGRAILTVMAATVDERLAQAFVELADTLVAGYDLMEFLQTLTDRCVDLLEVDAAGLLLADGRGALRLLAASTEQARVVELFQIQNDEGPCLDCYRTGVAVSVPDLAAAQGRWPLFAPVAVEAGFASVHAVPMRLHQSTLGVLGLFGDRIAALSEEDLGLAQALADVASVALVTGRAAEDKTILAEQLQAALDSRVVLEQAKGIVAQGGAVEIELAFVALRGYSRDHNLKLTEVAHAVVSRRLLPSQILGHLKTAAIRRSTKGSRGLPGR